MRKSLGIMLLSAALLAGCGSDKPVSMEDLETYIWSKDEGAQRLDMENTGDVEKAREDLKKSGIEKFAQYDSENGVEFSNVYKYKDEELAIEASEKVQSNKPDYNYVHYQKGQYVLTFTCMESENVFEESCPNYEEKFSDIEKKLGKADHLIVTNHK